MKLKKILTSVAALGTAAALMVGCAGGSTASTAASGAAANTDSGFAPMKIAYATNAVDEVFIRMQEAYTEVIGPALNIEFMFSEAISDTGALTTFIENSYASGCDAVITNLANSIDQAAGVCEDLGLYFVGISSADAVENYNLEHYVSVAGASAEGYGDSYAQVIEKIVGDGQEHSILILSGAAAYGATSFIEGTAGSLRALQNVYDLTYTQDIDTLATSSTQVDAENDKGIKITIFPGMADLATNVSPLLQTGDYDVVVGTTNIYDSLGVAINEVETALNMDIKFITRATFNDAITNAFNTTDSQGSPVIDGMVCNGTYENISAVLMLRNAFDGNLENMRDGDRCSRVPGMIPLAITSPEDYNILSSEDMPYSFVTDDELLSLCGADVTWEQINEFGAGLTAENIIAKFGG